MTILRTPTGESISNVNIQLSTRNKSIIFDKVNSRVIDILNNKIEESRLTDSIKEAGMDVFNNFHLLSEDKPVNADLRKFVALIQQQVFSTYPVEG